nr:Mfa1 family fimbria major subunit [uncultured Prevotella sp.]
MKRFKSLFMLGVLAMGLGLTSCSSDDPLSSSTAAEKGNTYVAVSLSMPQSGTRAGSDYNYIGDWVGNDDIKKVDIYLSDGTNVTDNEFTVGDGTDDGYTVTTSDNNIVLKPKKAIKTTPGTKSVYVVINQNDVIKTELEKTATADFEKAYKTVGLSLKSTGNSTTPITSASQIASEETATDKTQHDVIAMTNSSEVSINVAAGIREAQTLTETDPQNRITVSVQRAVARVMVTTDSTSYAVTSNPTSTTAGTRIGRISNITWALAQGENSLYVQQNSGYETPSYTWVSSDADYISNAGNRYDYSGLFENPASEKETISGTTVPTLSAYKALDEAGDNKAAVLSSLGLNDNAVNGKFILPTTHTYGADGSSTGYRKGNTAYVLVRAKFTPAAYADGGTANTDGTFFLGANGKYYTTAGNAVDPTKGGVAGQTVAKYVGGKVLYYAWLNPDNVATPYNSPVLRNNIYHIHITGFKTIGTNWNPLYPENPNATNPTNPDPKPQADPDDPNYPKEPTNPIDPNDPLTTPETWMSVDVTVLPWQVHSYGVDLGI